MIDKSIQQPTSPIDIYAVMDTALTTVAASSARIYAQTYTLWLEWCATESIHPLDLRPRTVHAFLVDQPVTSATRKRHLAALRTLAKVLALDPQYPEFRVLYEGLRLLKAPDDNVGGTEREKRTLHPRDVWTALAVWEGDDPLHARNRAILAVLFYTGMRRSEVAALRWSDVDFEAGIIRVRHGKGDKAREVAIVAGQDDVAKLALEHWQTIQSANSEKAREFIFCGLRKGGRLRNDKPLHVRAINQIVEQTTTISGVTFTPHDARRTLGTDLLANNHPLTDVQAQLGHQHASTTLQHYAMPADARKRRGKFKTSY